MHPCLVLNIFSFLLIKTLQLLIRASNYNQITCGYQFNQSKETLCVRVSLLAEVDAGPLVLSASLGTGEAIMAFSGTRAFRDLGPLASNSLSFHREAPKYSRNPDCPALSHLCHYEVQATRLSVNTWLIELHCLFPPSDFGDFN